jgi:hypothetical protein
MQLVESPDDLSDSRSFVQARQDGQGRRGRSLDDGEPEPRRPTTGGWMRYRDGK